MAGLTTLPGTATVDDVLEVIDRDGGVIVQQYLSSAVMDELRADLMPKLLANPTGKEKFHGLRTRRLARLFAHSRRMVDVVTQPLFLESAKRIIDTPIVYWRGERQLDMKPGIRIGVAQLIQIGPGEPAQMLHRDDWSFLWRHPSEREARLQIMLAMTEFTAANGGTLVIPGSHRWDDDRVPRLSEAVSCEMRADSALFFIGSTYHAGGTNVTTDQYRTGLTVAIDAANVRQEENQYLEYSPDLIASYPSEIQSLLGWSSSTVTRMGWVDVEGRMGDPRDLLPPLTV